MARKLSFASQQRLCLFSFVALLLLVLYLRNSIFMSILYSAYEFHHVRLVDELPNGSLVYRTGLPMKNQLDFLWWDSGRLHKELRKAKLNKDYHVGLAKKRAKTSWHAIHDHMPLVDVSLLTHEKYAIDVEKAYFKQETKPPNEFVHYPVAGIRQNNFEQVCTLGESQCGRRQPADIRDDAYRKKLALDFEHWDNDHTVSRMAEFTKMVSTGEPRIYFFHCICGCDRTGAFFLQYTQTQDPTLPFVDLLHESAVVSARAMYYPYQVSAQWYCEFLLATGVYSGNDCGACDSEIFRCEDTGFPFDRLVFNESLKWCLLALGVVVFFFACHRRLGNLAAQDARGKKE